MSARPARTIRIVGVTDGRQGTGNAFACLGTMRSTVDSIAYAGHRRWHKG